MGRIKDSIDDPLRLEVAGHALYDLYPERRGNLFSDEVYRLVKAGDATLTYAPPAPNGGVDTTTNRRRNSHLPPNHKFSTNDVIILTRQPQGSGDFFDPNHLPTSSTASSVEARVISTGPTYLDIALPGGAFEVAFGPAPNNIGPSGRGDARMRLRADRFFSNVPYTRQVAALTQLTAIPDRKKEPSTDGLQHDNHNTKEETKPHDNICMDDVLREIIIATHAFTDPNSSLYHDVDACDLQELVSSSLQYNTIQYSSVELIKLLCVPWLLTKTFLFILFIFLFMIRRAAKLPSLPCRHRSSSPTKHWPIFKRTQRYLIL